ncbi:MAG: hypothetical protein H7834_11095 [Magnetococcus sp. YQC-9]
MMISASSIDSLARSSSFGLGASGQGNLFDGFGPGYQLEISDQGLALSNPVSGVTETRMRNVLTRILLETLFGTDANSTTNDPETAKQELVREVVVDPMIEDVLGKIATLNRIA